MMNIINEIKYIKLIILILSFISIPLQGQENPKIDKDEIIFKVENKRIANGNLKRGEYYYKKQIYDQALIYYQKLFEYIKDNSELNYKIGVSSLYGGNSGKALIYFLAVQPQTASDYYYQLGKAYHQSHNYNEAIEAFKKYIISLPLSKQLKAENKIRQLSLECVMAEKAIKDSSSVQIINMGPKINSYYDEYAGIELKNDSLIIFTTRRPEKEHDKKIKYSDFKERVFFSNCSSDSILTKASELKKLRSSKNISVAGIDNRNNSLIYYMGKFEQGNIYAANFKDGKIKNKSSFNRKINTKNFQETTLSISDKGDCFFVSDINNGVGGKDIWYVKQTGKKRFTKPQNIGPEINTQEDEECVYVTSDGKTLFFSSNGHSGFGGFDIYRIDKGEDGLWSKPQNMGYPVNSTSDDMFYYPTSNSSVVIISSQRDGGYGGFDLYLIKNDHKPNTSVKTIPYLSEQ